MPPKAMQIRLGISGVDRVRSGFKGAGQDADAFATKADRMTDALERLSRQMGQMNRLPAGLFTAPAGRPSIGGSGGLGSTASVSSGSLARLKAAQAAVKSDSTNFDFQVALARAEQRFRRDREFLRPQTTGDKLNSALLSSRIGFSGSGGVQLMPLVNRVLPLFGEGITKLIGPLGLAYFGLSALAGVARGSAETLHQAGVARQLSGGSPGEVAALTSLGVPADQLAQLAQRFREKISLENGDMFAISAAQQIGMKIPLGRNYGPTDEAKILLEGMEKLRGMRDDPRRQLKLARQLDMDSELPMLNVSDSLWAQMREGIARRTKQQSGADQLGNNLQASETIRNNAWQNMTAPLGRLGTKIGTEANLSLADAMNFRWLKEGFGPSAGGQDGNTATQKEATERNTKALEKLAKVVGEGTNPLGPRGRHSLRLTGPELAEAARAGAFLHRAWDTSGR